MKSFLGLRGLLLLLFFMRSCANDWAAYQLRCTNHWFYLRVKATMFHNIYMESDEVFLGIGCPVSNVWPHGVYDFTYRTYSCGIVNKVINNMILLQTKLKYVSKNSTTRVEMRLSCIMHSQYPLICEAESKGDFTGDPPEWAVDMSTHRRDKQAAPAVPQTLPISSDNHQVAEESSGTSLSLLKHLASWMGSYQFSPSPEHRWLADFSSFFKKKRLICNFNENGMLPSYTLVF